MLEIDLERELRNIFQNRLKKREKDYKAIGNFERINDFILDQQAWREDKYAIEWQKR
jgi:hypothetical protein